MSDRNQDRDRGGRRGGRDQETTTTTTTTTGNDSEARPGGDQGEQQDGRGQSSGR